MRICIVGAGSIGGYMAVKLALAGEQVSVVARGENLKAIQQNGLRLSMANGESFVAKSIQASNDMAEIGPQDIVILAVKAHQIEDLVSDLPNLFDNNTIVVTTQNGIPWWYFHKHGGPYDGTAIKAVDPKGRILDTIDADRIIGSIAYPAAEMAAPGHVRHIEGHRFPVGELDGSETQRVTSISEMFSRAGMKSPILKDIRSEIWLKLWGNLSFNPISALTHSTLVDICQYPGTRELVAQMMTEAQSIANKLGIQFRVSLERRIAGAEKVGKHKTSMLQDLEAGKAMEIEALVGAVVELGRLTQTPTPNIDAIYACVGLLGKTIAQEHIQVRGTPF